MPIYEYQCAGCHHAFDVIQKMNDEPIKTCPVCSKDKAVRLVSAAGFQLKGTGWYATDFKTKNPSEQKTVKNDSGSTQKKKSVEPSPSSSSTSESK